MNQCIKPFSSTVQFSGIQFGSSYKSIHPSMTFSNMCVRILEERKTDILFPILIIQILPPQKNWTRLS